MLTDLKAYSRFIFGLRSYLKHPISLKEAKAIIRKRLDEREEAFLRLLEKGVFGNQHSPYLPLLRNAGCQYEDIQAMVRQRGLEKALAALREAGVFVTFDEFKGRAPIVRNGLTRPVQARDFDNPHLSCFYRVQSGGSTGAGTRVPIELDHLAAQAPHMMLTQTAHGVLKMPQAIWLGILPDGSGMAKIIRQARFGRMVERWFSPLSPRELRPKLKNRLATNYIISAGRKMGVPLPHPEPVRLDEAKVVARWMMETLTTRGSCLVSVQVSRALRICLAAREEGWDLTGAVMWVGGEPPTPAKVAQIIASGARCFPGYWLSEAGVLGQGCTAPIDKNDIHIFEDAFALISTPREVPGLAGKIDAFALTSLLPSAPKLMLNVEIDDYGIIERRSCGCLLEECGFDLHARSIASYRKITGEGVTLVGTEMQRILEEVLPARFGGTPLDYQLLEEEDEQGFTRLVLLVSPRIRLPGEGVVIETVLEALGQSSESANVARHILAQAGSFSVRSEEPIWTDRCKLLPLHVVKRAPETSTRRQDSPGA